MKNQNILKLKQLKKEDLRKTKVKKVMKVTLMKKRNLMKKKMMTILRKDKTGMSLKSKQQLQTKPKEIWKVVMMILEEVKKVVVKSIFLAFLLSSHLVNLH